MRNPDNLILARIRRPSSLSILDLLVIWFGALIP